MMRKSATSWVSSGTRSTDAVPAMAVPFVVGADENPKVQFGDRDDTDSRIDVGRGHLADADGGVEYGLHEWNGSTSAAPSWARSSSQPRGVGPFPTRGSAGAPTQRCRRAGCNSATGRPATVTIRVSPASTRRSTPPTWLRSVFWKWSPWRQGRTFATGHPSMGHLTRPASSVVPSRLSARRPCSSDG